MNDNILVTTRLSISPKKRISLIKSTSATEGDKLVVILRPDYLEVKELSKVVKELNKLKECLENATTLDMLNFYQERIDLITACVGNVVEVDKQGRIIISSEIAKRYNFADEIILEGILDGFRIWEPEKFEEYQTSKINKFIRK